MLSADEQIRREGAVVEPLEKPLPTLFDRVDARTEQVGDGLMTQSLETPVDQEPPVRLAQLGKTIDERPQHLVARHATADAGRLVGQCLHREPATGRLRVTGGASWKLHQRLPQDVVGDPEQPSSEGPAIGVEISKSSPSPKTNLLDDIVGIDPSTQLGTDPQTRPGKEGRGDGFVGVRESSFGGTRCFPGGSVVHVARIIVGDPMPSDPNADPDRNTFTNSRRTSESVQRVVVDFLTEFVGDRENDNVRPLVEYLVRFPGYEEDIARRYIELIDTDDVEASASAVTEPAPLGLASVDVDSTHTIDRFQTEEELGRGGQGIVYRAYDPRLERDVALKVIEAGPSGGDDLLIRFRREAVVASKLDHPGLVAVYDAGRDGRQSWIAMQLIRGQSLQALIKERPIPTTRSAVMEMLACLESAARALHAAHEVGVVHRDVKPGNIMVTPNGRPVLLDFGLARDAETDMPTLTATGTVLGTPTYMAPEQLTGASRLDRRVDVYGLGATLFRALTGRAPFESPTVEALVAAIRTELPPSAIATNAAVSADLDLVLQTALAKDPTRRYSTALTFADDLLAVQEGRTVAARTPTMIDKVRDFTRRRPTAAAAAAGLTLTSVVAIVGAVALWVVEGRRRHAAARELHAERGKVTAERERTTAEREKAHALRERNEVLLGIADLARARDIAASAEATAFPFSERLPERTDAWVARAQELIDRRNAHRRVLERLRTRAGFADDGTRTYANDDDQWTDRRFTALLDELDALEKSAGQFARTATAVRGAFVKIHEAGKDAWPKCIAAMKKNRHYDGLDLVRQDGLVPLHESPVTGLWEFWAAGTGTRPVWDDVDEIWVVGPQTGMVLALLPGGSFMMGADPKERDPKRRDPWASQYTAPVHEVRLDPFFMAAHEMTQGQWLQVMRTPTSTHRPESETAAILSETVTLAHPVESLSKAQALRALYRLGLTLPTEAQWEYACRAGTSTTFYCGRNAQSLDGYANVLGQEWRERREHEKLGPIDDDYLLHAPVGSFESNAFGLFDMHGNVAEWCRDHYATYDEATRSGDGRREVRNAGVALVRGGAFSHPPRDVASARRNRFDANVRTSQNGLRAARPLQTVADDDTVSDLQESLR